MKAAVLNIGNEVLIGHTINTNLSLIAKKVMDYGISIEEQITVKDDREAVIKAFKYLLDRYDMIFTSGGLGPTEDDITSECIAKALGRELVLNDEVLESLETYFKSTNRVMTPNNKKQALFPEDSVIIRNDLGTASGFVLREKNKWVIVTPGPPLEVENILMKFLEGVNKEKKLNVFTVNTYGIGESSLEDKLRSMEIPKEFSVNSYLKDGVQIKIVTDDEDEEKLDKFIKELSKEFKEHIYDCNSDSISKSLLDKLMEKGKTIAFAESCTGGKVSSKFTENPGASNALICSLVTYSEEAKIKELGVSPETLEKYTAVSREVAMEMLEGLMKKYDADYYGITTGYASPTDDASTNGLVYIGIYDREKNLKKIDKTFYRGSRTQIIDRVTNNLFFNIIKVMDLGGKDD